jgi:hypothetical protein
LEIPFYAVEDGAVLGAIRAHEPSGEPPIALQLVDGKVPPKGGVRVHGRTMAMLDSGGNC